MFKRLLILFIFCCSLSELAFAREVFYNEVASTATTSSNSYLTHASITFLPQASTDYFILWSAGGASNQTAKKADVGFRDTTDSVTYSNALITPKATSDVFSVFGMGKYTAGGSPTDVTFDAIYKSPDGSNVSLRNDTLTIFRGDAADAYAESTGATSDVLGSYVDKTTDTFTPASTGYYVCLATAETNIGNTADATGIKLDIDGTPYGEETMYADGTADWRPWGTMVTLQLTNASHTAKIAFKTTNVLTTAQIRNARVLCTRKDTWANYTDESTPLTRSYENRTRATKTDNSFNNQPTSGSFTPGYYNAEQLIWAGMLVDMSDSTNTLSFRLLGFTTGETLCTRTNTTTNASTKYPHLVFFKRSIPNVAQTWQSQWFGGGSGPTWAGQEGSMVLLDIGRAPTGILNTQGAGR